TALYPTSAVVNAGLGGHLVCNSPRRNSGREGND
ncbi:MAG: hypothetical protein ACI8WM_001932, partial [Burkholderiaceae bacterium]